MEHGSTPIGLSAGLDIALALSGFASEIPGERELCAHMSEQVLGSVASSCECDPVAEAFHRDLVPCLWTAARALIADQELGRRRLREAELSYAKSRDALDRLAGVGSLGVTGWLARIGALVAGFGIPQLIQEALESREAIEPVLGRSVSLARAIEIAIVQELHEPFFAGMLIVSLAGAVLATVLVTRWIKRYRARRIAALADSIHAVAQTAREDAAERHAHTLALATQALARVFERHYPGSAVAEIALATSAPVTAEELLSGAAEPAVRAFAAQHLDVETA